MIKGIIFDADHTLYVPHHGEAYEKKFSYLEDKTGIKKEKIIEKWTSIIRDLVENSVRDFVKRSREYSTKKTLMSLGINENEANKLTEEAIDIFWRYQIKKTEYDPDITNTIKELGKKYRLCVASDEFRRGLELKLNHVFGDWKKYFEFIVSSDDTKELKPSEKFCKIPLGLFGLKPEEVVFVGDSWERELRVAKEMGLLTVLVGEEREGEPDYCVKKINDILGLGI